LACAKALIPASPAAAAWLSARYGWRVAARILGVLATAIAITLAIRIGLGLTA